MSSRWLATRRRMWPTRTCVSKLSSCATLCIPTSSRARAVMAVTALIVCSMMACVTKSRMEPTMLVLEEMEQGNMRDFLRRVCCPPLSRIKLLFRCCCDVILLLTALTESRWPWLGAGAWHERSQVTAAAGGIGNGASGKPEHQARQPQRVCATAAMLLV